MSEPERPVPTGAFRDPERFALAEAFRARERGVAVTVTEESYSPAMHLAGRP